jgi:AcrR family transcriptional regulator
MARKKPSEIEETPRGRDREATEQAILKAARVVLARDGFQVFGVNAIAREAGCDKQLIYRYFGGLEGVGEALGARLAEDLTARLEAMSASAAPKTYVALMETLALALLDLARSDPLMLRINAWELVEASPLLKALTAARSQRMTAWMHRMRGDLAPPPGVDAPAVNAVVIAGVQHLALASMTTGAFSGLPLKRDADWVRVQAAVRALVRGVYS